MSHLHSSQNQVGTDYSFVKMSNQTDPPASGGNKLVRVVRNQWAENGRLKFIIIALGIFVSFLCVGLLQETFMKNTYGEEKEKFKYANTLVEVSLVSGLIFINSE